MKKKKFTKPFLPVHMGPRLRFLTQKSVNNLLPLSHEGNTKVATLGLFRVKRPMQCVQQIIWAGNVLSEAYMCCLPACWPIERNARLPAHLKFYPNRPHSHLYLRLHQP